MLRKFLIAFVIVLFLLVIGSFFFIRSLQPTYSGAIGLSTNENEVEVYFDNYGIPHIYAQSETDAYRTLGYLHAQDRLFQLEVVRRIAPGRLSEIFGTPMIETDKLFRTLGMDAYSEKEALDFEKNGNPATVATVKSYLQGVNEYVENGADPIEFLILGIEKTPFTIKDIHNVVGYMSFSFAAALKTEPLLTKIVTELGSEYLNDLDVDPNMSRTLMKNHALDDLIKTSLAISEVMDHLPASPFIGSNGWVVGPKKTASGKLIFANDPHIKFSQPAVWYEAHMEAPGLSVYGHHLAGFPFANLLHNEQMAFGLTMFENDDMDFFKETINPENANQYQSKGEWIDFIQREEIIHVKDTSDIVIKVMSTVHGPVINDVVTMVNNDPISMFWTYMHHPSKLLEVTYGFAHSETFEEARSLMSLIHAPGLNIMYGDKWNNYARWSVAKLIKRPPNVNSKLIMNGADSSNDLLGYYEFENNPKSENAPWGYAYSANNQPDSVHGIVHPGYYLPEDRAKRIIQLLENENQWDATKTQAMITDVVSLNSKTIVQSILETLDIKNLSSKNEKEAIKILKSWNGASQVNDIAPTLYNKLIFKILEATLLDELGEVAFKVYLTTHLHKRSIEKLITNNEAVWWDDLHTKEVVETRAMIIQSAFEDGILELENQLGDEMAIWLWGKVHTLEHEHPFGKVEALRKYFNVGIFEAPGTNEVINNNMFTLTHNGEYRASGGPSTRRIIDFSNVKGNSWGILPTGNSGNPLSPFYNDQAEMYVKGEFRKMMMDKAEIIQSSKGLLLFKTTK